MWSCSSPWSGAGDGLALVPTGLIEMPGRALWIVHRTELLHSRTADPPGRAFMAALTGSSL